jgi:hypothetical protein
MLIVKFFALLGAALAIYLAAALQNGPDTTDANLCKLLRRFSASLPDQCLPSLDNYGTAFAIIFTIFCVLLLLWDFRKHVFISVKFAGAVKRLWAKVEPSHIIILGLAIAVGGVVWQYVQTQRTPKPVTQSNISDTERAAIVAPFQAQIDELRKQIASIPRQSSIGGYYSSRKTEQPVEKEFTKRTVRELRAIYEGRTRLQADVFIADEKGKLIEAEGTIVNVDSGMVLLQTGQTEHNGMPDYAECRFSPEWNAKLGTYRQNEHMKIRGVIGPNQNGAQIYLQECEIIG